MRQLFSPPAFLIALLLLPCSLTAPTDPTLPSSPEYALEPIAVPDRPSPWSPVFWWAFLNGEYGWFGAGDMGRDNGVVGRGWLGRWLSMGGEGVVTIMLQNSNITLPHRPAAFPNHLPMNTSLPSVGILTPFHLLPPLRSQKLSKSLFHPEPSPPSSSSFGGEAAPIRILPIDESDDAEVTPPDASWDHPDFACVSPAWPPIRFHLPSRPYLIALVERGGCDFATKVRAAQERGAAGVIVGDGVGRLGETDEEGREREGLITMFSPETDGIFIPSVFVSRASYLSLNDMLRNGTDSQSSSGPGIWVEIGEGTDEGGALSSLLSFALLMPSLFLLTTIAIHRIRLARQREADRAPPLLVLSLPERIWTPDIVWEKDDDSDPSASPPAGTSPVTPSREIPPPPPISPSEVRTPPQVEVVDPALARVGSSSRHATRLSSRVRVAPDARDKREGEDGEGMKKPRTKSGSGKKYFSKDECAICMDSFQRGDVVRILPCGHVFHKEECDEWLMKWRKLCPTCRADVTLPSTPTTPIAGSTITPVAFTDPAANPTGVVEPLPRSWSERTRTAIESFRAKLWGRREGTTTDERTPLIPPHDESGGEV